MTLRPPKPCILIDIGDGLFVDAKSLSYEMRRALGIKIPQPRPYRYKKRKNKTHEQ